MDSYSSTSSSRYTRVLDEHLLKEFGYGGMPAKFLFPPIYNYNVPNGVSLRFVYQVIRFQRSSVPIFVYQRHCDIQHEIHRVIMPPLYLCPSS